MEWPAPEPIESERLRLEPLTASHATEMVAVLADPGLYEYTGGEAPSLERLRLRYAAQAAGQSADGSQGWLNWIVRGRDSGAALGFVQATVERHGPEHVADIAWVVSTGHQGQGIASEATRAMVAWLRAQGISGFTAHIHPGHGASMAVARHQGLQPTDVIEDGEIRWES